MSFIFSMSFILRYFDLILQAIDFYPRIVYHIGT